MFSKKAKDFLVVVGGGIGVMVDGLRGCLGGSSDCWGVVWGVFVVGLEVI